MKQYSKSSDFVLPLRHYTAFAYNGLMNEALGFNLR